MEKLEIKTGLQILKPAAEVFDAIVDAGKMRHYFISKSSGYMKEGETISWQFPEMDMEFPVTVGKIEKDKYVSFYWDGAMDGEQTFVEIQLNQNAADKTFVSVTEKSKPNNEAGIKWLKNNTEGWANFLACMKAWMEYDIHLRRGAFDPSQMPV
jgi:uncharacterized protein YndB with AHSA1/START domain